ncbi:MAG: lipid A biosynthesis acyltransferase [Flavobacteriales bacterium]|nr:lipid A biosynthesis acyltransferase [Flavobacteriales bacterium]
MSWDGKTRGNLLGQQIFVFALKRLGLRVAYFILLFVAAYFFLFVSKSRKSVFYFFHSRLGYSALSAYWATYINFYKFGQNLIDKFAILSGEKSKYSTTHNGGEYLDEMTKNGTGGVLMSGHIGNFEVGGQLLERLGGKINVIMQDEDHEKIKKYMNSKSKQKSFNIIPIKNDLSHVISIKNALAENEFICVHGDRYMEGAETVELDFLGKKAKFPKGPFVIATRFGAPVTFAFVVKTDMRSYRFSATKPKLYNRKLEECMQDYVAKLEEVVKANPHQWFNHYEFWA